MKINPKPIIPVSWGELIDKLTILEIKSEKITLVESQFNILKELNFLNQIIFNENISISYKLIQDELKVINLELWHIEDDIRKKEELQEFDKDFIDLARSVYKKNDIRAKLKQEINQIFQSELKEEKSYNYLKS